jgi:hypothetical protein
MPRRLLVVVTAPHPEDELLEHLPAHADDDVEVLVVAPPSDLSFLQWLADDEDEARALAERRARKAAEAESLGARVVGLRVGDPDPLTAIEDALRTFPADEVVLVTRPEDSATWLERDATSATLDRLGVPVTHLVDDDPDRPLAGHLARTRRRPAQSAETDVEEFAREIARGRNPWPIQWLVVPAVVVVAGLAIALILLLARGLG